MFAAGAVPEEFRERISHWRCGSGTFRMNVALSELPDFTCLPGKAPADHHTAGIIIAPTLSYMEQAYFDARSFGWSRKPIVEIVIPSTLDETLAPAGRHPGGGVTGAPGHNAAREILADFRRGWLRRVA